MKKTKLETKEKKPNTKLLVNDSRATSNSTAPIYTAIVEGPDPIGAVPETDTSAINSTDKNAFLPNDLYAQIQSAKHIDNVKGKPLEPRIVRPNTLKKLESTKSARTKNLWLRAYALFGLVTLLATTSIWAYLGAKLQQSNADQLVNTYLFENAKTFQAAIFPAAHSFIIKWPLFLIIRLSGSSVFALQLMTVLVCLATVSSLAFILYKIDRRPAIFGTLMLALAAVLLYVPAQPYAGGILPVNMAMLANRNIEYIVYIISLIMLVRAKKVKSINFGIAAMVLLLLGLSDRLFLTLALGGAGFIIVVYGLRRQRQFMVLGLRWLAAVMVAILGALAGQWLINRSGLTHLSSTATGSPYAVVHSLKSIILGLVFGLLNSATNFGANPAYDAAVLRRIPEIIRQRMSVISGLGYVINGLIATFGILVTLRLSITNYKKSIHITSAEKLSVLLIASSFAAVVAFVVTDHYYVVDARYLTIILFTVFISLATWLRRHTLQNSAAIVALLGPLLFGTVLVGVMAANHTYSSQLKALSDINQRNSLSAQALVNHPVDILIGDYWRVLPIKDIKADAIKIMPLDGCTQIRQALTSQAWQADITTHSFAYLLSFDKSLTNFPGCTLEQISTAYGRPNSSFLVSGTHDKPKELLLFYEKGVHKKSAPANKIQTILPITPEEVSTGECQDKTVLNIVAHQDDDLLFLSPDLLQDIASGKCIRTLYVTAGDAGSGPLYWQARERGSQDAYSTMLGNNSTWTQRVVKIADNQFITVVNPRGNAKVALIFMRLADGNLLGRGFAASHFESLEHLEQGKIKVLHSVDNQSAYSLPELTNTLVDIMKIYKPIEVKTQKWKALSSSVVDHSDHLASGIIAKRAYDQYNLPGVSLKYYEGYSARVLPANVAGDDLAKKTAAFLMYAKSDGGVCQNSKECNQSGNYGLYLKRQYSSSP